MPFRIHAVVPMAFCAVLTSAQGLPEAPGKVAVENTCGRCHGVSTAVQARETKRSWDLIISDMISRGATGSDEDFDIVEAYLLKYYGKVNINTAPAKEIEEIVELSSSESDAIVRYRTQNGGFKTLADLKKVPNLDSKKIDDVADRIAFR